MCVTSGGSDGARRAIDSRGGGAIVPIRKRFRRGKSFYENDTNERGSWLLRVFRLRENTLLCVIIRVCIRFSGIGIIRIV